MPIISHFTQDGGESTGILSGIICMWSGAANAIPAGWALCDGANGTPDLRGRFVLGAGGSYGVGATGGEEMHTLDTNEMPRHAHTVSGNTAYSSRPTGQALRSMSQSEGQINPNTSTTTEFNGWSRPHNNMPPYYALCYIMKL